MVIFFTAAQGDGDHIAPRRPALGLGAVEGNFIEGPVPGLHHQTALPDPGVVRRRGDNHFLHLCGAGEGQGDGHVVFPGGGKAHAPAVLGEQVVQAAGDGDTRLLQLPAGGAGIHRRGEHHRVPHTGGPGGGYAPAEPGQVHNVNGPVAVQVIDPQVLGRGGAQNGGHGVPVQLVHPAIPVHIPQGKRGVPGAQGHVLGEATQGHALPDCPVPQAGELQDIAPQGQTGDGQVQISGAHRNLGGAAAQGGVRLLVQGKAAQKKLALVKLYLDLAALKLGDGLVIVQPEGEGNAAGCGARRSRPGRGQGGAEHGNAQQCGEEPGKSFHSSCVLSLPKIWHDRGGGIYGQPELYYRGAASRNRFF